MSWSQLVNTGTRADEPLHVRRGDYCSADGSVGHPANRTVDVEAEAAVFLMEPAPPRPDAVFSIWTKAGTGIS